MTLAIDEAPLDDEPDDDDCDGGLTEARAEADTDLGISTTELEERLGLEGWPNGWFDRVVGKIGALERLRPQSPEDRESW